MTIKVGDRLPQAKFMVMDGDSPAAKSTADVFSGRTVALFAVPGAYTSSCHKLHMPGFVDRAEEIKSKGVDAIACTAVNDIFVLTRWAQDSNATGKIEMLADGSAEFATAIGMATDLSSFGLGTRSRRYAMLVKDGVVAVLNVDDIPPQVDKASAETLCSMIDRSLG